MRDQHHPDRAATQRDRLRVLVDSGIALSSELSLADRRISLHAEVRDGAFARLSERCKTLLRLLISDEEPSYEEIGAALGMPVGAIGPTSEPRS